MKKVRFTLLLYPLLMSMLFGCSSAEKESLSSNTSETQSQKVHSLDVYGEVSVDKTQQIIIDFPAKITGVYIKDGDHVNKGDKLLSLDYEDYKLDIKTKENEIHMNELELKQLKENINPQMLEANKIREELNVKKSYVETGNDPDLIPLQNSLSILEHSVSIAKNDHKANADLFQDGLISEEEFNKSKQNLESKQKDLQDTLTAIEKIKTNRKLEVNALNAALNSSEIQSTNTDNQKISAINILELKIETAKLVVDSMKSKLSKPYIKGNDIIAPENSLIIYDINCIQGTEINSQYGPILKAMHNDTLYVTADIPEESISLVQIGSAATISLSDEHAEEIAGKISKLSHRAIEKDGDTVVEAVITIEKGKEFLKPGLSTDIHIFLE